MGVQSGTVTAIEACSPAKLNLFLHVTGRRPDGYHSLQTVFQLLNWGDDMRFEARAEPGITLSGHTDDIAPEQNLILKAARALGQPERGAHIPYPQTDSSRWWVGRRQLQCGDHFAGPQSIVGAGAGAGRVATFGNAARRRRTGLCNGSERLGGGGW